MATEQSETVWVRRQWNDWRLARYRIDEIEGLHLDDLSGGINVRSPRRFLSGYVWCDAMLEGELAHSCSHGEGPHRIKVCVVKKDNPKKTYQVLLNRMQWAIRLKCCPFMVEAPPSAAYPQQIDEMDRWVDSQCSDDTHVKVKLKNEPYQVWFANHNVALVFSERFGLRDRHHQNQEKQQAAALRIIQENMVRHPSV